jgi:hypothetical protein
MLFCQNDVSNKYLGGHVRQFDMRMGLIGDVTPIRNPVIQFFENSGCLRRGYEFENGSAPVISCSFNALRIDVTIPSPVYPDGG